MHATYSALAQFVTTWGMLYFVVIFAAAVAYALWPRNQSLFDSAARIPLNEKEPGDDRPLV